MRETHIFYFCLALCIGILFAGCDQTFQPFQENEQYYFTIFGYLDAAADTQWVRVAPARQQINMPPKVPEMQVTLENLENGQTVVMNDSLVVPGNGFNYINFYTLTDIKPNQTYRIKAEGADGKSSQVTVTTPEEFSTPRFLEDNSFFSDTHTHSIIINGVDNLVDVQTWWYVRIISPVRNEKKKFVFSYRNEAEWITAYGGAYLVEVIFEEEEEHVREAANIPPYPEGKIEVLHRQVYVASAGPEWDEDIASLNDLLYSQPGVITNVEDGLGYMVGVYSKVVPYKTCLKDESLLIPCEEEEPYW